MSWLESLERWFPILDLPLFRLGNTTVTVATVLTVFIIIIGTLIVARLVGKWLNRVASRRSLEAAGSVAVTARLVHYSILFVGFGIALHTAGVDLTALFAASAVFGVILGFAMQNIASNFVSGVILLFERSIKPGDILEVEGRFVTIKVLGIRATIARSLNEEDLIIPNTVLVQAIVKNYTLRDSLYRLDAPVGVVYGSDMAEVRSTLEKAINEIPWRSSRIEPVVLMREFGDSSVNFAASVWIEDPWKHRVRRSELNETIWWALKNAGITIAFPQLDVHFDSEIERSMTALAQA